MMKNSFKEGYFTNNHRGMLSTANLEFEQFQCQQSIKSGVSHLACSQIEDIFKHSNIDPKTVDTQTYKQVESLYLHKKIAMFEEMIQTIDPRKNPVSHPHIVKDEPIKNCDVTFSQLYKLFLMEKERSSSDLAKTTLRDYETAYADFVYVIEGAEDRDITTFTKKDFRAFINALHDHLPISRTKKPEFRDLSYAELMKMELQPEQKMAYETKKKKISSIKQIFDIAADPRYDYIPANHAHAFLLKKDSKQREERKPLTDENLKKLFASKYFINPKIAKTKPQQYWIPIIALFTGMRQNEICQLHISDIKQEVIDNDGLKVWYFDLNEDGTKHLKNANATRLVPIHPALIDLGFLDYFNTIKEHNNRLFPQLRLHPTEERYNIDYNKTFGKYFRAYITKEANQVFHSIRHNVGDQLIKNAVHHKLPKDLMNQIMGHEPDKDMTSAVYSQGYGIRELYEGIKTLKFTNII
jgi:integrase